MTEPERDPEIPRSDRERDAALLEQRVAEPQRRGGKRTSGALRTEV